MTTALRALLLRAILLGCGGVASAQSGSIRGVVHDRDFEVPLAGAQVTNVETRQAVLTSDQGAFLLTDVPPGTYTLVFSKEGYVRSVETDVIVTAGRLTEVDGWLSGEFTDMEEFVVEDVLHVGDGTEVQLLQLRFESPALLDSIGSELMSKAGANDAAAGLKLVAGATVQDGKSAVIRGLPDRYVSSQMNSVRLPSADDDKRAVELDQFPAPVIESIQVSKTFTPDQQGDASGGAVDVRLRGVPNETIFQVKGQLGYNTNAGDGFLSYEGGGLDSLGDVDGHGVQPDGNWTGGLGGTDADAPLDYKFSVDLGRKWDVGDGWKVGGFASFFYERDSSYYDDGRDDALWVESPGDQLTPEFFQGTPGDGNFRTALFDIERAEESVRLGTLGTLGIESKDHSLSATYLRTRVSEDVATIATDTRAKEHYFPGHDPDDPNSPGSGINDAFAAPYIRTDTLEFTERTTDSLQLEGNHVLPFDGFDLGFEFGAPVLDWRASHSSADSDQPDGRQFSAYWVPILGGLWQVYKPSANITFGNAQHTFKRIEEDSEQYALDLELPFEQWSGLPGYLKFGVFDDEIDRVYEQESFSNFGDESSFTGGFDDPWSVIFDDEDHFISASDRDIDYDGEMDIAAWYSMLELPLLESVSLVGGVRFESTEISTTVVGEENAQWLDPNSVTGGLVDLMDGDADVAFDQDDVLPAIGLSYRPAATVILRGSYSETVARQTFKELTPIAQSDYVGGPIFSGNPDLQMSSLQNYDVRVDYTPVEESLLSLSWFYKDIEDPIEYVRRVETITYTQPTNYPEGELSGYEVEVRQGLGRFSETLGGLAVGANATFIDSRVELPADEVQIFENHGVDLTSREATNAPEYLYNLYLTYDLDGGDTQIGLFYTVQGDTLITGAGADSLSTQNFVPSVYQTEYGTLNLSVVRRVGKHFRLQFQAKNLTDPDIETVYRSDVIDGDVTKSSYSLGREFTFGISVNL